MTWPNIALRLPHVRQRRGPPRRKLKGIVDLRRPRTRLANLGVRYVDISPTRGRDTRVLPGCSHLFIRPLDPTWDSRYIGYPVLRCPTAQMDRGIRCWPFHLHWGRNRLHAREHARDPVRQHATEWCHRFLYSPSSDPCVGTFRLSREGTGCMPGSTPAISPARDRACNPFLGCILLSDRRADPAFISSTFPYEEPVSDSCVVVGGCANRYFYFHFRSLASSKDGKRPWLSHSHRVLPTGAITSHN